MTKIERLKKKRAKLTAKICMLEAKEAAKVKKVDKKVKEVKLSKKQKAVNAAAAKVKENVDSF